jgi:hypothetical protein
MQRLEAAKKRLQLLGADPNFSEVAAKESLQQKSEAIAALEKETGLTKGVYLPTTSYYW